MDTDHKPTLKRARSAPADTTEETPAGAASEAPAEIPWETLKAAALCALPEAAIRARHGAISATVDGLRAEKRRLAAELRRRDAELSRQECLDAITAKLEAEADDTDFVPYTGTIPEGVLSVSTGSVASFAPFEVRVFVDGISDTHYESDGKPTESIIEISGVNVETGPTGLPARLAPWRSAINTVIQTALTPDIIQDLLAENRNIADPEFTRAQGKNTSFDFSIKVPLFVHNRLLVHSPFMGSVVVAGLNPFGVRAALAVSPSQVIAFWDTRGKTKFGLLDVDLTKAPTSFKDAPRGQVTNMGRAESCWAFSAIAPVPDAPPCLLAFDRNGKHGCMLVSMATNTHAGPHVWFEEGRVLSPVPVAFGSAVLVKGGAVPGASGETRGAPDVVVGVDWKSGEVVQVDTETQAVQRTRLALVDDPKAVPREVILLAGVPVLVVGSRKPMPRPPIRLFPAPFDGTGELEIDLNGLLYTHEVEQVLASESHLFLADLSDVYVFDATCKRVSMANLGHGIPVALGGSRLAILRRGGVDLFNLARDIPRGLYKKADDEDEDEDEGETEDDEDGNIAEDDKADNEEAGAGASGGPDTAMA